ncbi:hypothetical protein [uncultured Spirosoma sp.]|uniref:hypothetical protein n=1 Tax=uncultured Spirosoma sp. TaxID=278208 RepID=UPI0025878C2E|nr:hypothetical protein [uncultured Spirosoma sp.]
MDTYTVDILNPKALRLLEDLADMKLIDLKKAGSSVDALSDEEKALARERVLRGGSQTLDVDEMIAYVNETRERSLPFRED